MTASVSSKLPAGLPSAQAVITWSEDLTIAAIYAAAAIGIAFALHWVAFAIAGRAAQRSASKTDEIMISGLRLPIFCAMAAVAISVAAENNALIGRVWTELARFIEPALFGWVVYALVQSGSQALQKRAESHPDNLAARSRKTRVALLSRAAGFLIVFVTIALVLFGIPAVRSVGTTLLASAGLATLAIGAAAQPALKSLIAGMQIALTEPIRIGDYIVVDKESGRVEDIRLSYVVIRTGDERRIIVPTAKFLDGTFENWTRAGGGITGSVVLPIKPGVPIAPIRETYEALLAGNKHWDKRTGSLQVSEVNVGSVELKLVMSAKGPTALASLRPEIREAMLEWLRETMPDALCDQV